MKFRHSRESGNPFSFAEELAFLIFNWIPAFAGMTGQLANNRFSHQF
jgi:hypothetical protein